MHSRGADSRRTVPLEHDTRVASLALAMHCIVDQTSRGAWIHTPIIDINGNRHPWADNDRVPHGVYTCACDERSFYIFYPFGIDVNAGSQ